MKSFRTFKHLIVIIFSALLLSSLISCSDSGDNDDSIRPQATTWGACPDYALLNDSAQCSSVSVPLDYAQPTGQKLDIFVFRYLGSGTNKKGQVWFLEGGPGGSGAVLAPRMAYLAQLYPDFDYYALDHRGVGGSGRVGCKGDNDFIYDQAAYSACVDIIKTAWGDDLRYFTTTNAARDVGRAVDAFRQDGVKVFIYGTSYGTYWTLRYLTLFPEGADGAILDSVCTPGDCYLDRFDGWNDLVGRQFLDLCGADPVCEQKMSTIAPTPEQAVSETFRKLDEGSLCPQVMANLDRSGLRRLLSLMLQNWTQRVLIPPLIYRLNRCDASDQRTVQQLLDTLAAQSAAPPEGLEPYISPMMGDLIIFSELYGGKTVAEATQTADNAYFSEDQSLRMATFRSAGMWDLYSDEEYAQKNPTTDVPLLMMNGNTDPQSPLEIAGIAGQIFTGPHQTFVTVPWATHGVVVNSPMDKPWPEGSEPCGSRLVGQFMSNPAAVLDTSCADATYPLEFDGGSANNQATSQAFFGVSDMWDGPHP